MSEHLNFASIAFSDDFVNVQYVEMRKQTKRYAVMDSIVIEVDKLTERQGEMLDDILESVEDFLDDVVGSQDTTEDDDDEDD